MRKQLPIEGNIRFVKHFALLPTRCNSNEWAWLETVYVKQCYYYATPYHQAGWQNLCFVDEMGRELTR